jgi:SAM-dependent methyltransferase
MYLGIPGTIARRDIGGAQETDISWTDGCERKPVHRLSTGVRDELETSMIGSPSGFQRGLPEGDTSMATGTEDYYRDRALEYDRVYRKPERQSDLRQIRGWLSTTFDGRRVVEVAAGTGYWTDVFADAALGIVATDFNRATLEVARARRPWPDSVAFVEADAFELHGITGIFDAAFAGFFWSHVPLARIDAFLEVLFQRIGEGARVVLLDNRYVEGSNHPVTRTDEEGNTYQMRSLDSGANHEVLKNFPTPEFLRTQLEPLATDINVVEWEYFWAATCAAR